MVVSMICVRVLAENAKKEKLNLGQITNKIDYWYQKKQEYQKY
jgi:hypothetical protein